jgi:hypothetical protein
MCARAQEVIEYWKFLNPTHRTYSRLFTFAKYMGKVGPRGRWARRVRRPHAVLTRARARAQILGRVLFLPVIQVVALTLACHHSPVTAGAGCPSRRRMRRWRRSRR